MRGWRSAAVFFALVAAVCLSIAVFTTFDTVEFGVVSCGSPIDPRLERIEWCADELDHARATRTAALAWGTVALAGAWGCDAFRRRARARATQPLKGTGLPESRPGSPF